jgi:ABC-type polysaccharide/polyol phosphate export permease
MKNLIFNSNSYIILAAIVFVIGSIVGLVVSGVHNTYSDDSLGPVLWHSLRYYILIFLTLIFIGALLRKYKTKDQKK